MSHDAFGWAIVNGGGYIMLPVNSTRVTAIAEFVASIDATIEPRPEHISALGAAQSNAWRRCKSRYGVRCIRVRVTPAFDAPPALTDIQSIGDENAR